MNVYVIYKFDDVDIVKNKIEEIKKAVNIENNEYKNKVSFYMFPADHKKKFWHKTARNKIKMCNIVAFFDLFDYDEKRGYENIKWELKCAEKYKKRIIVFKKNSDSYAEKIYETDFSGVEINRLRYSKVRGIDEAVDYFKGEVGWSMERKLLEVSRKETQISANTKDKETDKASKEEKTCTIPREDKELLMEQYRLMIETSERLMDRRQSVGSLYTTICTALIAFVGASFGFSNLLVPAMASLMSGLIIIVLCINWRSSLNAYDLNNGGKFAVINEIEKHLPAEMFECEYKYNTLNGIRSYSTREMLLPLIFALFGVLMMALSVVLFLVYYL